MINYRNDWRKKKPEGIFDILKEKANAKPKKVCAYEWQDRAFDMAKKLNIDFKKNKAELPKWLSLFKNAYNRGRVGRLENCYSFVVDYTKQLDDIGKIRLFFWRYGEKGQIKRE